MGNNNISKTVLIFCAFLVMTGVGIVVPSLPQKILSYSGSIKDVGYLASFFAVTYIIFQVPVGNLSDRFGFVKFIAAGYLLCGIAGIIMYFAHGPSHFYFARVIHGLGEVPVWSLAPVLLSFEQAKKGKITGFYNASIHLGLTIGAFAGVYLSPYLVNGHFLYFAGTGLICALLISLFVRDTGREMVFAADNTSVREISVFIFRRDILIVFVGIALYGACYGIYFTVIPSFLIKGGYDKYFVSLFFALFYLVITISQIFAGPLSDFKKKRDVMGTGFLLSGISIFIFTRTEGFLLLFFITLGGFGLGIFYVSSQTFINQKVEKNLKGTISGFYYFFWGSGFFAGPVIVGVVCDKWSFENGIDLVALSLLLISAGVFIFVERKRFYLNIFKTKS